MILGEYNYVSEPWIVAHRGASKDAPENTIPAFLLAWEQGADAIEGDFHLTGDGHIVCLHDPQTKRVAGINRRVATSTLEELRQLDVGRGFDEKYAGTGIPTLAEVLAIVPDGKKIYIEIKVGQELIPELLAQVKASGLSPDQIYFLCLDAEVIRVLKDAAPQYKASWLVDFKKDLPRKFSPSLDAIVATLRDIRADGLGAEAKKVDESFLEQVMDTGIEYHVWTVDNAETALWFKQRGVKSITTNVPALLRELLADS